MKTNCHGGQMYKEKKIKNSEFFQLLLLNSIYSHSGSEQIIFQGGTALRWIYGGMRFSEDLDFVTHLPEKGIEKILVMTFSSIKNSCIAQFGPGLLERQKKKGRPDAVKDLFIYRPENQRERIAVKVEFEKLRDGYSPKYKQVILRDIASVSAMISGGDLIMPYSSSIILSETLEEILSDKIRAIFERKYLKGRDIYDIWWLSEQLKTSIHWPIVKNKFSMYEYEFIPVREADFFQKKMNKNKIIKALETDLPRFIPQNIYDVYKKDEFRIFIKSLSDVTSDLLNQGMKTYINEKWI